MAEEIAPGITLSYVYGLGHPGPPTVGEVVAYLQVGDPEKVFDEVVVQQAFDAEKAAQAARCRVPLDTETWPEDLVEALMRRVARNLAVRSMPLGFVAPDVDGASATYLGSQDPEVKRFEAPHRRRTVG